MFLHCMKNVEIRSFSDPYFPVFGLYTGKCGPERTPHLDFFHAVLLSKKHQHWSRYSEQVSDVLLVFICFVLNPKGVVTFVSMFKDVIQIWKLYLTSIKYSASGFLMELLLSTSLFEYCWPIVVFVWVSLCFCVFIYLYLILFYH